MIMDYHASYYARELNQVDGTSVTRLSRTLFDASANPSPHQIETALFAIRSALSNGMRRADEGVHPCSAAVQTRTLRAEVDTKTKKSIRNRTLERFPMSRNRKDVDLYDLVPCWLTDEWRVA
jgi:hypothetical protein